MRPVTPQPGKVKPITCARCGQTLTMAFWDRQTAKLYCQACLPPLPPSSDPIVEKAKKRFRWARNADALLSRSAWKGGRRDEP